MAQPLSVAIANARVAAVDRLLGNAAAKEHASRGNVRDRIGVWSMHPVWGVPVLGVVLYIAWLFVGKFGAGTLVEVNEHHTVIDFDEGGRRTFATRLVTLQASNEPAPNKAPARKRAVKKKKVES